MNDLQCALLKSGFRRHELSRKFLELKSVRASASVVLERILVESTKSTPSLEFISDLREFLCEVIAFSCGKNVESKLFYRNCTVKIWFVMSVVVNTKNDSKKLTILTGLEGVGVKAATFILSVFYPSKWGYVTDPSIFYSALLGFVLWSKTYHQIISVDDAIAVNGALVKISKEVGIEVADVSSVMFLIFFYGYRSGFRSGTGKKYGASHEQ